jgi:cysteine synthase
MSRRLAGNEGLFAGASTGVNVVAALRIAERLGSGATVATLMIDTGIKYLGTEVYHNNSPQVWNFDQCSQAE